jgi:hypothetical protein
LNLSANFTGIETLSPAIDTWSLRTSAEVGFAQGNEVIELGSFVALTCGRGG